MSPTPARRGRPTDDHLTTRDAALRLGRGDVLPGRGRQRAGLPRRQPSHRDARSGRPAPATGSDVHEVAQPHVRCGQRDRQARHDRAVPGEGQKLIGVPSRAASPRTTTPDSTAEATTSTIEVSSRLPPEASARARPRGRGRAAARRRLLRRRGHGRVAFGARRRPQPPLEKDRWAPMPKRMAVGSAGQRGDRDYLVHPQHRHHIEPRG